MKVLVTGSSGLVGGQVVRDLLARGDEPVLFDRALGQDILDGDALDAACAGCDGVVHSAAMLGLPGEDPTKIFEINVLGTWNVLSAARVQGVRRFVYLSSVNAMGIFQGQRSPDYLPIDDAHRDYPSGAYGISKHLGEEMCRDIARVSPMSAVALRPPWILHPDIYGEIAQGHFDAPEVVYDKWEYGAFIDARDMSRACLAALDCQIDEFESMLVCAGDVRTPGPTSQEMVNSVWPDVEWRGGDDYDRVPFRSLVDCAKAVRILGFLPEYRWADAMGLADQGTAE